ncbi:MAG: hypothetical protein ACE5I1_04800 [bacterium]
MRYFLILFLFFGCHGQTAELIRPETQLIVDVFDVNVQEIPYTLLVISNENMTQIWWVTQKLRVRTDYKSGNHKQFVYPYTGVSAKLDYDMIELLEKLYFAEGKKQ